MNNFTNAQILASILNKFIQPVVSSFAGAKLNSIGAVQAIENKIRSTGWVSGSWSISGELAPFIQPITGALLVPTLNQYLSQLPDAAIPTMAHNIIDAALENGELSLIEGFITFEKSDLTELKRLLNINLPVSSAQNAEYTVKTEEE